jgi:polyhydroxyalkanoate synthase subunit PhaC
MGPFAFRPDAAASEIHALGTKLGAAIGTLRKVEDVTYGVTEREEIWRDGKVALYRFRGERPPTAKVPLLIVYALVNRPYMVDLQEDRSIVRNLLAQGEDVYLIDWGYPDRSDRYVTLDDYINEWIRRCVQVVARRHRVPKVNLLGICQGGAFSLCYTALHPQTVQNLVTMVTPVDFHTADNMLSKWTRAMDVDLLVDTLGNVPGDLMNWCYLTLKPFRLNLQKYVGLLDIIDDKAEVENFLRMEKWIFDSPDQAGEAFRQFIRDFYQANKLVKGGLEIGGRKVDLKRVTCPVLNIYAEQDHLVPPSASRPMGKLVGTKDYTELAFKGGHIGIYVSGRSQREVPPAIHRWLKARG